ncbi:pua rna binding domain-containing protein [Lipomyces oligophaga]|uniref:pua rna binding domain-containing protein n=1 Tax=Lipomyces oligophaga TaxID=45792 RepID=UPI0034CE8D02
MTAARGKRISTYETQRALEWTQKLRGKILSSDDVESDTHFPISKLPNPGRIIRPSQLQTFDWIEARLNVVVDKDDRVTACWTG